MGDVAISALVREVVGRLASEVTKELALFWGLNDDISTLKADFEMIKVVLKDAEEKHSTEKAVELWLKRLKSTSLEVENVLDEISTEAMLQRLHKERGIKYRLRAFFSTNHNKLLFRIRIAHKLKALRKKLDVISSMRSELSLTHRVLSHVDVDVASEMPNRETSSLIHDSLLIFGRNEEMEMVIKTICNKDVGKYDKGEIRVYGMWGMGGVGKTTLAQLVYNHEIVNNYFEFKCWVYVSQKFQVKEIIQKIIESIDKHECNLTQLETLQESLRNRLKGKKFLVVLDDVWIEDNEKTKWDQLRETISCGAEESAVVTTTRSQTTCAMMAKVPELQHKLGCLSNEDSWLLFKKLAFAQGRERDDISVLEPIGREIVEKCKGLPLAVKTLGSLMWSKSRINDWQHVKDNHIWELQENKVLPALKLSYDNLLPHLRRCFAYCGLFPKGHNMEKDVLITLWVSNGFIPHGEETDCYRLGEEILNCLVWRSFFTPKVDEFDIDRYIMHDLMHDMVRHEMRDDCLVIEHGNKTILSNEVLHLSSKDAYLNVSYNDLRKFKSLWSIFMYNKTDKCIMCHISNHHMYLRVLYLEDTRIWILPESICKLKYLRYLNLSKSFVEALPESVMYLQNLQVLDLSSCYALHTLPGSICYLKNLKYLKLSFSAIAVLPESIVYLQNLQMLFLYCCRNLRKLPKGLRYMKNLQSLDIDGCNLLTHLPLGIKELTRLRKLPIFHIGNKCGAKIGELGDLNLLEGTLWISGLENVGDSSETKSANLKCKTNLSVMVLSWPMYFELERKNKMFAYDEMILEGLEPNPCLKELRITAYMGKIVSPSWMVKLSNLVKITFFLCGNCEHIQSLGRLASLRVIQLSYMSCLKCFHDDDTTNMFLCVEELLIDNCPSLVSLPNNLPKLKVLKLHGCGKLVSLPCNLPNIRTLSLNACGNLISLPDEIQSFKDLNKLEIRECKHLSERYKEKDLDWSKISHISNIDIHPPRNIEDESVSQ